MRDQPADGGSGKAPADGERRAIRNLAAQYLVAAAITYDALLSGELEWIRLVDPEAERVDDLLIGRPGRVDAYQVKWSLWKGNISFKTLVEPAKVSGKSYPSAFSLLAQGWRALSRLYPARHVRVHYLTHDAPSASDKVPNGKADGAVHLQAFLAEAFAQRARWCEKDVDGLEPWADAIAAVGISSGLEVDELPAFFSACELDLNQDLPITNYGSTRGRDIAALAQLMHDAVAKSANGVAVELDRGTIISRLDWGKRFEPTFTHEFPVDEQLYRPVVETIADLDFAFGAYERGYVAVIGPPGSGKSTTLTQTLRYREGVRLVRYYAFVRDDTRQGRGEAAAFLRDLCLALDEQSPPGTPRAPMPESLEGLRDQLGRLLGVMHDAWTTSGVRTIILIDGLDHIEREQSPIRPLIHELPAPASIPDGVLVVLGTQQAGLDFDSPALRPIRAHLQEPGRTIRMAPLARAGVFAMLDLVVPALSGENALADEVYRLSAGHPLALTYLLKRLAAATGSTAAWSILEGSDEYQGDIEQDYASYWQTLREDRDTRELLGLICRMRGTIDLDVVKRLASEGALERFARTATHYFTRETPQRWTFFHNSFRQFLRRMTDLDVFGQNDPERSRAFHMRLAEIATTLGAEAPFAWDRIHHLLQAGRADDALVAADQALFRAQVLAARPIGDIQDDIRGCLQAASQQDDRLAAFRLLLSEKEMGDRASALEQEDPAALALDVAAPQDTTFALFTGHTLNVDPAVAIKAAADLLETQPALARRAFDAAEPLGLLSGVVASDAKGDDDIRAWARAAWRFRPLPAILEAICHVRVDPSLPDLAPPYDDVDETSADLQESLMATLARSMLRDAGQEQCKALLEAFSGMGERGERLLTQIDLWYVDAAIDNHVDREAGEAALAKLLEKFAPDDKLDPEDAVWIADRIVRLGVEVERADAYLALAPRPFLLDEGRTGYSDDFFAEVESLMVQARVQSARGRPMDPAATVPNAIKEWDQGNVLFQRVLILVGTVWGEALRGAQLPAVEVERRLRPAIRFYRRPSRDAMTWHHWHQLVRSAPAFFKSILKAADAHGRSALHAIIAAIETDRDDPARQHLMGWTLDVQRAIAMSAWRIDGDRERAMSWISAAEQAVDVSYELEERVSLHRDFLRDWLALGERDRAQRSFDQILNTSFGIGYHKDYQMGGWCTWAARRLREGSPTAEVASLIQPLLNVLPVMFTASRGADRDEPTRDLLAAIAAADPGLGLAIGQTLINGNLARRSVVTSGLLRASLQADAADPTAALVAVAHLVVPFDLSPDRKLIKIIERLVERPSPPRALAILRGAITTKATGGARSAWSDVEPSVARSGSERDDDRTIHRSRGLIDASGQEHHESALAILAHDPQQLLNMLAGAKGTEDVDWSAVLPSLPAGTPPSLVTRLLDRLSRGEVKSKAIVAVVECALRFGLGDRARVILGGTLDRSKSYAWVRMFDGGSRLAAARAMVLLDGERGRARAFQLLVEDYLQGLNARELVHGLSDIADVLFSVVPIDDLWIEIRNHVAGLAEAAGETVLPSSGDVETTPERLAIALLEEALEHPVAELAIEARKGLVTLIGEGDATGDIGRLVRARLSAAEPAQQGALELLLCATTIASAWVSPFSPLVEPLAWAPNTIIRLLAQHILIALGSEVPPPPPEQPLPALYRLELRPAARRGFEPSRSAPGAPLADTSDPVELTRPINNVLSWLADETDISCEVLERRIVQLMTEAVDPNAWSFQAEERLLEHIKTVGPPLPYRRPRPVAVTRALGRLVSELVDAGIIPWLPLRLTTMLTMVDTIMSMREPEVRPDWLEIAAASKPGEMSAREWPDRAADGMPTARYTPDGWLILAEQTTVRNLDRNHPEELRGTQLVYPGQWPSGDIEHEWFHFWSQRLGQQYPAIPSANPQIPVIAGGAFLTYRQYLAVNPALAAELGWEPTQDGLFRWLDQDGAVAAESRWWTQGQRSLSDYAGYDETASEGWLVLVAPSAIEVLRAYLPRHRRVRAVVRRAGLEDEEGVRAMEDEPAWSHVA